MSKSADLDAKPNRRWGVIAFGFVLLAATSAWRGWRYDGARGALIETFVFVAIAAVIVAVEKLLRGRARLWGRIVEVSFALGLVLCLFWLTGAVVLPLVIIWLVVTGGLIALAILQPEVTT
jgi:chromate transport protein ChrA